MVSQNVGSHGDSRWNISRIDTGRNLCDSFSTFTVLVHDQGHGYQWRIQGFPDGDTIPQDRGENLLFDKIFAKNCMKMKEIRPRGCVSLVVPLDTPMAMTQVI